MTFLHALQVALAIAVFLYGARAARRVLFDAACDATMLLEAIETAQRAAQPALARAIAEACRPAWAAAALAIGLDAAEPGSRREADERIRELLGAAQGELAIVVALGRMASPLAFLAIVIELAHAFGGDHGLRALQRGLVETVAINHALLSFAVGLGTAVVAAAIALQLRSALRQRMAEAQRALAALAGDADGASM